MAIIKCPECARDVSDSAPACPNCGYPLAAAGKSKGGAASSAKPKLSPRQILAFSSVIVTCFGLLMMLMAGYKALFPKSYPSDAALKANAPEVWLAISQARTSGCYETLLIGLVMAFVGVVVYRQAWGKARSFKDVLKPEE